MSQAVIKSKKKKLKALSQTGDIALQLGTKEDDCVWKHTRGALEETWRTEASPSAAELELSRSEQSAQ